MERRSNPFFMVTVVPFILVTLWSLPRTSTINVLRFKTQVELCGGLGTIYEEKFEQDSFQYSIYN